MHACDAMCKAIVTEHAKGERFKPTWNSLSHPEQEAWLAAKHASGFMPVILRAIKAAKVLVGL